MAIHTPREILLQVEKTAFDKSQLPVSKIIILGLLAGAYIAMGGLFSIIVGYGFPEATAANPGLQRLLSGLVFPLGLMLVVFAGAELFTGNNAVMASGAFGKSVNWRNVLINWVLVYFSNFAGALLFAYFLVHASGVIVSDPWHSAAVGIAQAKVSMPWMTVFLKGIGANWLVCLAVWLGLSADNVSGRILGLFFPVFCFVAIGYEHCIANMFFIPLGMMSGAEVSLGTFIADNLIPATLGNIVGGAVFVGGVYWYLYGKRR